MSEEKNMFYYKLSGDAKDCQAVAEKAKGLDGVINAEYDSEELKLSVELSEHASEYDVFCSLAVLGEAQTVEVDYFEDKITEDVFESVVEEVETVEDTSAEVEHTTAASNIPDEEKPWKTRFIAQFIEIGISAILLLICQLFSLTGNAESFICLIAFSVVGYEIIWDAVSEIVKKNYFNYNVPLVLVAIVSLFVTSYREATLITLIFQAVIVLAKVLKSVGDDKLKKRFFYNYCEVKERGKEEASYAKDVAVGETLDVEAGTVVPFDALVNSGEVTVEYSFYNKPTQAVCKVGDVILGGGVVKQGSAEVTVNKTVEDSFAGVLYKRLSGKNTSTDNIRKKQSARAMIISVCVSLVIAFLLPVFFLGNGNSYGDLLADFGYYAIIFLALTNAVSCAYASSISYTSAVNQALSLGVFVNLGSNFEALADCNRALFNEPGALTESSDKIGKILPAPAYKGKVLGLLKEFSISPKEILASDSIDKSDDGKAMFVGTYGAATAKGYGVKKVKYAGEARYVFVDGEFVGVLVYENKLKKNAYGAIKELADDGVSSYVVGCKEGLDGIADIATVCKDTQVVNTNKGKFVCVGVSACDLKEGSVNIRFCDVESTTEGNGLVIPDGSVKSVAKTVKLAKHFKKLSSRSKVFSFIVKAVALVVGVVLAAVTSVGGLWVAVLIDAVMISLSLILSAFYAKSIY